MNNGLTKGSLHKRPTVAITSAKRCIRQRMLANRQKDAPPRHAPRQKRISDSAAQCQLSQRVTAAEQHMGDTAVGRHADSAYRQCGQIPRRLCRMGADRPHLLTRRFTQSRPSLGHLDFGALRKPCIE